MMTLYHGSNIEVAIPLVGVGRENLISHSHINVFHRR